MLTKRELNHIKKALPQNGYMRTAEKAGVSKETVKKVLNEPKRYNLAVIQKALEVIKEYKQEIEAQKNLIKEVTS